MKKPNVKSIKPLLLAASLTATAPVWSQGVVIYGGMDMGVEAVSGRVAGANDRDTAIRVSNGMATPHFGLRGSEDLGGGMKAAFNLESSFAPDTGALGHGGRLFGRQAWVDLSGPFGTVRLGRQYTMFRYGFQDVNPFGYGNHGLRLLDPRISNPRADNSISYLGKWGPVSGGVNYSTGWDAVNGNPANAAAANCPGEAANKQQCREWSLFTKYDGGHWGVTTAYERMHGGTAATFGGLTSPDRTDTRFVLGSYLNLTDGKKLAVGWIKRNNEGNPATPKSDMVWVQGVVPLGGPYFLDGSLAQLKYDDSPNKAVVLNVRGRYEMSKRTSLYLTTAFIDNSGTLALSATGSTPAIRPVAGSSQTSVIIGVQHRF